MIQRALTIRPDQTPTTTDILADFGKFLRLYMADGDASPATIRSYYSKAGQFVAWCAEHGINPAMATEDDIAVYRRELVAQYEVGTVAVKLAAIRRLYEAAVWRGLRQDNPAAGLRAPKDRTERAKRIKFLPLDGLRRLLDAPKGDSAPAVRDRAILALMGCHGLRVSEVAALTVGSVDLCGDGTGDRQRAQDAHRLLDRGIGDGIAGMAGHQGERSRSGQACSVRLSGPGAPGRRDERQGYPLSGGYSYLERLGLKAKDISCHSLRHSAATWARAGGAKLDASADMMGYADVSTTRICAQIVNKMQENPKFLEAMLTA